MDSSKTKVPLPSGSESEQQTIFEKQTLAKTPQVSDDNDNKQKTDYDTESIQSESDNEGVSSVIESAGVVVDKVINKAADEVDRITSDDNKKLLETDIDKIDEEIIEILREKSVERDEKLKSLLDDATSKNNDDSEKTHEDSIERVVKSEQETVKEDTKIIEEDKLEQKVTEVVKEEAQISQNEKQEQKVAEVVTEIKKISQDEKITEESPIVSDVKSKIEEEKPKETLIDEDLLPKGAIESFIAQAEQSNKPPVPIQTYLWEDVKRSKEQVSGNNGGYPWTHLYKKPLGEDEEPEEVILTYDRSPKSGRRSQPDTPKSQKKVRIQDEVEVQESEQEAPELPKEENESIQAEDNREILSEEGKENQQSEVEIADVKKSPKSILKRSQKLLDNIKPNTSKFDSDSLKRKIKNPLQKIKKMADQQILKVKTKTSIKKIPIGKDEIVLNEEVKILKLKESPKSNHREFPAFIVKQDSDDTIDIVDLEQSPSESRKQRLIESGILTPDEIINLPVSTDNNPQETDSCKNIDEAQKPRDKEMSPTTVKIHTRKEHIYEEIDDFVAKIAFDSEHVERVHCDESANDAKLKRQDNISDPIFDEFSRELNKKIRKSLSSQDDSIRHELTKKIPKIEELEKQISDEDREEKLERTESTDSEYKNPHLLAPISSIDSTSSDEDRRAQLSIVAEESETSDSLIKKKSFDEPSVDMHDIESLKIDDSDVETLVDDNKTWECGVGKIDGVVAVDESDVINETIALIESAVIDESPKAVEVDKNKEESPQLDLSVKEDVELKENVESPAPIKIDPKWSKMSDHEYEPIGEPMLNENETATFDDSQMGDSQKRKSSDPLEQGNEKKLLRSPSDESEDNISAQDFQDQIESRFFRKEIEPISDNEDHKHQEVTLEEAVIIDEEPVVREIPKKKSFMESAQVSGKNFQKKIKAQASSIKTSLNNKMKKKPKEKPVAVEVAHVEKDDEPQAEEIADEEKENVESITINVQEAEEEASKSKKSKLSKFTKNITKPTMPKFKKPHFKKPELPKMPDLKVGEKIQNLRKLGRSKSMKESSNGDSTSLNTQEVVSAESVGKKKFDFGTYPRLIRDKFRRPRLPERSDASMVSESPAPDEDFNRVSQSFAQRGPVASRWPEYMEEESGKYQHFDSETDLDKERLEFEREDIRHMMTDEQRQLDDMDRENLQIHLMAKQEKFRQPYVEQQESDRVSEDDKLMWSGVLNKNVKDQEEEEEFEPNALRYDDDYKYRLDAYNNQELNRSSTPQTNQETQSSGSSGVRRRRGFLDDDDDEYFMRDQRISTKPHEAGEYIDSAIKEGLSTPDENALGRIGSYDEENIHRELTPEKPTRSLKRKKKNVPQEVEEKIENEPVAFDYYKTYPPNRPLRSNKKSVSAEPDDDIIFQQDIPDDSSDILDENEMETFKGIEHPDLAYLQDDFDNDLDYNVSKMPVPPTPPRRRKKKIRGLQSGFMSLRNEHLSQKPHVVEKEEIIVYRHEHRFVPLAQEEHFTTPTPTPRRTRSRSQISSYTLDDAESFKKDSYDGFTTVHVHDNKENDYATIKKETPSRPVRRKRSTKSLGDKQFATLPLMPRRSDHEIAPPRPPRNYSTIGPEKPDKPPRRKSAGSLVEISKTIKDDDYEEILDNNAQNKRLSQRLQSGDVVNKMKDRPLPPPPRPKRETKKPKKEPTDDDEKFDNDGDAERIAEPLTIDVDATDKGSIHEATFLVLSDTQIEQKLTNLDEPSLESTKTKRDEKFLPRQESDFSEPERPVEVEVSTQTDPLPYDEFTMDDEDVDIEEFVGSDGQIKTLEDILKEEQEAELERARQLAEAENLARGIEKFRENSQRSLSEHTRTSADRSRSLSRPITPSAVVVERKKSSPIVFEKQEQIMTEAGLFIHPITYDDFGIPPIDDEQQQQQPAEEALDVNNNLEAEQIAQNVGTEPIESPEPDIDEIIKQAQLKYGNDEDDGDLDSEMQRKIEEMIESVMNTAREEAGWIKDSKENIQEEKEVTEEVITKQEVKSKESEPPVTEIMEEAPPMPPPRRKSNIEESILRRELSEELIDTTAAVDEPVLEERQASVEEPIIEAPKMIETSVMTEESAEKVPSIEKLEYENETEMSPDIQQLEESKEQQTESTQISISQQLSEDRPSSPFPSRIHLSSLEIDNLSVSQLQAGRITASEIDSHSIVTNEFESKTTNLPGQTVQIELPPGLIEEIVERVRNADRTEIQEMLAEQQKIVEEQRVAIEEQRAALEKQKQAEEERAAAEKQLQAEQQRIASELQRIAAEELRILTHERVVEEQRVASQQASSETQTSVATEEQKIINELEEQLITKEIVSKSETVPEQPKQEDPIPPERPPLPEEYQQPSSPVPQSFYHLKDPSGDEKHGAHHPQHHHRRRKHQPKKMDSTSDDDYSKDPRPRSRAGTSSDQSVAALGGQFLRACGNSLIDSGNQLMEILRASSKDENSRDLHIALIILIIIVAGLFLMGTGEKSVHHHHWDFFNPPENQGR